VFGPFSPLATHADTLDTEHIQISKRGKREQLLKKEKIGIRKICDVKTTRILVNGKSKICQGGLWKNEDNNNNNGKRVKVFDQSQ
jgi:hypothetical protein